MRHVGGVVLVIVGAMAMGCAANGDDPGRLSGGGSSTPDDTTAAEPTAPASPAAPSATPAKPAADDPGPAPKGCQLNADGDGFFTRNAGGTSYVGYVPKAYTGKPTRLLVGLHGCGDNAYNFATWAVAPWDTRDSQDYIGISVDGASAGGNCWDSQDAAKVLAAIDDVAQCVYVHQKKVVLAGFSSGGILAYELALGHASRFAGLLVLDSTLSATGAADKLLSSAAYKLPIAHRAHTGDSVFPINTVRADWSKIKSAGFAIDTSEGPGDHDGTSDDWTGDLLPKMASWVAP